MLGTALHFMREVGRRKRMDRYWGNWTGAISDADWEHGRGSEAEGRLVGRDYTGLDHGLTAESWYTIHRCPLDHLAHWRRNSNGVRVICVDFYAVAGWQKGIEALDEDGMVVKEHGDAFDDAGGVDSAGSKAKS